MSEAPTTVDETGAAVEPVAPPALPEGGLPELIGNMGRLLAFQAALKDYIDGERATMNDAMYAVQKTTGSKQFSHNFGPKANVKFTLKDSDDAVVVADEQEFTDWVMEEYPTEVETVFRVRDAFKKKMLADCEPVNRKNPEDRSVVRPETGQIVPGLRFRPGGVTNISTTSWGKGAKDIALAEVFATPLPQLLGVAEVEPVGGGQ